MGNFYQQGRTTLTDLLPIMDKFASFDYASPTTESLAYRAYLVSVSSLFRFNVSRVHNRSCGWLPVRVEGRSALA